MSTIPPPESSPLASFSLTHVYYNPEDPLSLLSAALALLPQALVVVYVTTLYVTREAECVLMFLGQLACEGANFMLKRLIREERPKMMHGKGYGMPSSHAQFSAFFALYITLLLLHRGLGGPQLPRWRKNLYALAAGAGSVAVAASRVYLNYHTPKQVLVGYSAGLLWAVGWYVATTVLRDVGGGSMWRALLGMGACLWVRDRCLDTDLVVEGWRAAQEKKKKGR